MSNYIDNVEAELKTIIQAVWTEIDDAHFATTLQALVENVVEEEIKDQTYLPRVVIEYGKETPANLSIDSDSVFLPITIFRVDSKRNNATQTTLGDKFATLKLSLRNRSKAGSLVAFDIHEDLGTIDTSAGNSVNSVLAVQSKTTLIGAQLDFATGVLVTPYG